jgi:hypothetical protein
LVEGNSLPLYFYSFELLKENFKVIIEEEECDLMKSHIDSLEQIDNKFHKYSHVFDDPVACYMESFNSQNFQLMINCKFENKIDDQMVSKITMYFVPTRVLLQ